MAAALLVAACAVMTAGFSQAATSSTIVTATFTSASSVDTSGCLPAVNDKTSFGAMLPGGTSVTGADCSVVFGSSNDSAALRIAQADGRGDTMTIPMTGALDTSFDSDGMKQVVDAGINEQAIDVVVDGSSRPVIASVSGDAQDFMVERLTAAGALDTSFDTDGKAIVDFAADADTPSSIAQQPDGKIVVAGTAIVGGVNKTAIARLTTAGALDTTFDTDGKLVLDVGAGNQSQGIDVAVQPDGKILLCIATFNTDQDVMLVRLTSTGAYDNSFSGDGKLTIDRGPFEVPGKFYLSPDGSIYVATPASGFPQSSYAAKVLTDGTIDTTWGGGDGYVDFDLDAGASNDYGHRIVGDGRGRIIVSGGGGSCGMLSSDMDMIRLTRDGQIDTTFGTGGFYRDPCALLGMAQDLTVDADGGILLTKIAINLVPEVGIGIYRLLDDGTLDTSFGTSGLVLANNSTTNISAPSSMAWAPDGKLVIAGSYDVSGSSEFDILVDRFDAGTLAEYSGSNTWAGGGSLFATCLRSVANGASTDGTTWTPNATCPANDGGGWHGVPDNAYGSGAKVAASTTSGTITATANLRFGIHSSTSQRPGAYRGVIAFEVVAPNA